MATSRSTQHKALAQLRIQLAEASRMLDEIERRRSARDATSKPNQVFDVLDESAALAGPETRFATFIASGMRKAGAAAKDR